MKLRTLASAALLLAGALLVLAPSASALVWVGDNPYGTSGIRIDDNPALRFNCGRSNWGHYSMDVDPAEQGDLASDDDWNEPPHMLVPHVCWWTRYIDVHI